MKKYVIERSVPGVGNMSAQDLQKLSQKSNEVLDGLAGRAQWLQSYVADDKLFCVYIADGPESIREHAQSGGFPCDNIYAVGTVIDPTTADV
jgi:hypothetical protein